MRVVHNQRSNYPDWATCSKETGDQCRHRVGSIYIPFPYNYYSHFVEPWKRLWAIHTRGRSRRRFDCARVLGGQFVNNKTPSNRVGGERKTKSCINIGKKDESDVILRECECSMSLCVLVCVYVWACEQQFFYERLVILLNEAICTLCLFHLNDVSDYIECGGGGMIRSFSTPFRSFVHSPILSVELTTH